MPVTDRGDKWCGSTDRTGPDLPQLRGEVVQEAVNNSRPEKK
jgi:hypothetical protein